MKGFELVWITLCYINKKLLISILNWSRVLLKKRHHVNLFYNSCVRTRQEITMSRGKSTFTIFRLLRAQLCRLNKYCNYFYLDRDTQQRLLQLSHKTACRKVTGVISAVFNKSGKRKRFIGLYCKNKQKSISEIGGAETCHVGVNICCVKEGWPKSSKQPNDVLSLIPKVFRYYTARCPFPFTCEPFRIPSYLQWRARKEVPRDHSLPKQESRSTHHTSTGQLGVSCLLKPLLCSGK